MSIHFADRSRQDRPKRIMAIDMARGIALIAMASYHFTWDLEFFGYPRSRPDRLGGGKSMRAASPRPSCSWSASACFSRMAGRYAGAASGSVSPWSLGRRSRYRSSPNSPRPTASSSSASCTRSRWPACSGLLFLRLPALLTLVVAAIVIAAARLFQVRDLRPSGPVVGRPVRRHPALQRLCAAAAMVRRRASGHRGGESLPPPRAP